MLFSFYALVNSLSRAAIATVLLGLAGCGVIDKHVEYEIIEPDIYPTLTAIGYAPIASQRGENGSVKRIMAMKASKLDAYRELAEQVYGQKLHGEQALSSLVVESETLRASVEGVIRGARVVKTYPVGEDTYVTELSLDMKQVFDLYLTMAKPRKVRDVKYY